MLLLQQVIPVEPDQYIPPLVSALTTLVLFVVSFAIIYLLGKFIVARTVEQTMRRKDVDETLVGLALSTTVVVVAVLAIALAATIAGFGVVLVAFATLGGALALAVGFAAQDLISNFVAGIFIIQDEPFEVGDWIEWHDNSGVVREIQLRVTKLDTFDNQLVTVPNSDLANSAVVNNVANEQLRLSIDFGIGYGDDIEQAREAIIEEGAIIEGVLDDPAPSAPVTSLGDSAVVFSARVWIDPDETSAGAVSAQYLEAVKERFDAEGIDMPYPNTELSGAIEVANIEEAAPATSD